MRLPDKAEILWGFTRAALDDVFAVYVSLPGGMRGGGQKQPSHPHNPYDVENVDKNVKNPNPHTNRQKWPPKPAKNPAILRHS